MGACREAAHMLTWWRTLLYGTIAGIYAIIGVTTPFLTISIRHSLRVYRAGTESNPFGESMYITRSNDSIDDTSSESVRMVSVQLSTPGSSLTFNPRLQYGSKVEFVILRTKRLQPQRNLYHGRYVQDHD